MKNQSNPLLARLRYHVTGAIQRGEAVAIVEQRPALPASAFTISRDRNGNKTCKVKAGSARAFTIQTNGNLPATHRNGVSDATRGEVSQFVASFGTDKQRRALAAFGL